MSFQIFPLDPTPFAPLFALDDATLAQHKAVRVTADAAHSFPCRVSLEDAAIGEELLLINHTHMTTPSPYQASHAVYVRKDAARARPDRNEVPQMLTRRLLSLRAFDDQGFIQAAEIIDGDALGPALDAIVRAPEIAFADIHFAKRGCFAARATRA